LTELLGETMICKDGTSYPTSSLADKACVGLYFSAHWCPPCRGFTPELAKTYNKVVGDGKAFEIVFISSDKDEDQFTSYLADMPWKALPYSDRDRKATLSSKFKVQGIPCLVLLDGSGNVISTDGRTSVGSDSDGAKFPWIPPTFQEALGTQFTNAAGDKLDGSAIAGKTLALYFSAHWCPPCQAFTPKLADIYKKVMESKSSEFELIFVSSDRDEGAFTDYLKGMPWLALPYELRDSKEALSTKFGVSGIPSLVVVGPDGKVINANARGLIESNPEGFPWHPPTVNDLNETSHLNEAPCAIVFVEAATDEQKALATSVFTPLAESAISIGKEKDEDPAMFFYVQKTDHQLISRVRELCKLPKPEGPQLFILDIPNEGYYTYTGDFQAEAIKDFVANYKSGEKQALG